MTVTPFRDRDGVAHFVCVDCGTEVFAFGWTPAEPTCAVCIFLRDAGFTDEEREQARAILDRNLKR